MKSADTSGGFTIIEVLFFLAISAALLVVAFAGVSTTISNLRFRDSVTGLQSSLQNQYDRILNGVNTRGPSPVCGASTSTNPGQSNCLLLGKLITFSPNTRSYQLTTRYVVGTDPKMTEVELSQAASLEVLKKYRPQLVPESAAQAETIDIPWQAEIYDAGAISGNAFPQITGYLLLRSPKSGEILSFLATNGTTDPRAIVAANNRREAAICIVSGGVVGAPNNSPLRAAIRLGGSSTGQLAITTAVDDDIKPPLCGVVV